MTQSDGGTGEQVKDKASEVVGQAQEKAQQAAGQARDQVRSQIDQRSTDAGRKVSEQAGDLRSVGEQLREQGKEGPAKLAERAAHQVERAGSWLTGSDADRILHDVEDAARKNPWAVVAGGVVLGIAASRFLKASSSDRYRQRSAGAGPQPPLPRLPRPTDEVYAGPDRDLGATGTGVVPGPAVVVPGTAGAIPGAGTPGLR
jgi:hypothetical protein